MNIALRAAGTLLLLAATVLVFQLQYLTVQTQETMTRLEGQAVLQNLSLLTTQEVARATLFDLRQQVILARQQANERLDEATHILDRRLQVTNGILAWTAGALDENLRQANETLWRVSTPAIQIEDQIGGALQLFLDCDHNADCLFNRYVGMARGIERVSRAVGEAAPILAQSSIHNAQNMEKMTVAATGVLEDAHVVTSRYAKKSALGKTLEWLRLAGQGVLIGIGVAK